jgi:hypothetical protein
MLRFDQELVEIYGELDRDRLMALVVRYVRDWLGAGGSSIFLRDDITGRYVLRGTTGLQEGAKMPAERVEYEPGEGLTGSPDTASHCASPMSRTARNCDASPMT